MDKTIELTEFPNEQAVLRIVEKVLEMKEKETCHVQIHKESNQ